MALRGTAARRGADPVTGRLRDVEYRQRSTRREVSGQGRRLQAEITNVELTPGPPGEPGPRGPVGPVSSGVVATVAETDSEGRVVWTFTDAFTAPPIVTATPVDPVPGDIFAVTVNLETVTTEQVTARVWQTLVPAAPVGAGLSVHFIAVPAS